MTKRRNVLAGTAASDGGYRRGIELSKPAIAQSAPELKWRLTSVSRSRWTRSTVLPRCSPRPWPR